MVKMISGGLLAPIKLEMERNLETVQTQVGEWLTRPESGGEIEIVSKIRDIAGTLQVLQFKELALFAGKISVTIQKYTGKKTISDEESSTIATAFLVLVDSVSELGNSDDGTRKKIIDEVSQLLDSETQKIKPLQNVEVATNTLEILQEECRKLIDEQRSRIERYLNNPQNALDVDKIITVNNDIIGIFSALGAKSAEQLLRTLDNDIKGDLQKVNWMQAAELLLLVQESLGSLVRKESIAVEGNQEIIDVQADLARKRSLEETIHQVGMDGYHRFVALRKQWLQNPHDIRAEDWLAHAEFCLETEALLELSKLKLSAESIKETGLLLSALNAKCSGLSIDDERLIDVFLSIEYLFESLAGDIDDSFGQEVLKALARIPGKWRDSTEVQKTYEQLREVEEESVELEKIPALAATTASTAVAKADETEIENLETSESDSELEGVPEEEQNPLLSPLRTLILAKNVEALKALPRPNLEMTQSGQGLADEEIREIFSEEFQEVSAELESRQSAWSNGDASAISDIRRNFHTLKGSGRMAAFDELGEFAWQYENMLNRVLDHTIEPTPEMHENIATASALLQMASGLSSLEEFNNAFLVEAGFVKDFLNILIHSPTGATSSLQVSSTVASDKSNASVSISDQASNTLNIKNSTGNSDFTIESNETADATAATSSNLTTATEVDDSDALSFDDDHAGTATVASSAVEPIVNEEDFSFDDDYIDEKTHEKSEPDLSIDEGDEFSFDDNYDDIDERDTPEPSKHEGVDTFSIDNQHSTSANASPDEGIAEDHGNIVGGVAAEALSLINEKDREIQSNINDIAHEIFDNILPAARKLKAKSSDGYLDAVDKSVIASLISDTVRQHKDLSPEQHDEIKNSVQKLLGESLGEEGLRLFQRPEEVAAREMLPMVERMLRHGSLDDDSMAALANIFENKLQEYGGKKANIDASSLRQTLSTAFGGLAEGKNLAEQIAANITGTASTGAETGALVEQDHVSQSLENNTSIESQEDWDDWDDFQLSNDNDGSTTVEVQQNSEIPEELLQEIENINHHSEGEERIINKDFDELIARVANTLAEGEEPKTSDREALVNALYAQLNDESVHFDESDRQEMQMLVHEALSYFAEGEEVQHNIDAFVSDLFQSVFSRYDAQNDSPVTLKESAEQPNIATSDSTTSTIKESPASSAEVAANNNLESVTDTISTDTQESIEADSEVMLDNSDEATSEAALTSAAIATGAAALTGLAAAQSHNSTIQENSREANVPVETVYETVEVPYDGEIPEDAEVVEEVEELHPHVMSHQSQEHLTHTNAKNNSIGTSISPQSSTKNGEAEEAMGFFMYDLAEILDSIKSNWQGWVDGNENACEALRRRLDSLAISAGLVDLQNLKDCASEYSELVQNEQPDPPHEGVAHSLQHFLDVLNKVDRNFDTHETGKDPFVALKDSAKKLREKRLAEKEAAVKAAQMPNAPVAVKTAPPAAAPSASPANTFVSPSVPLPAVAHENAASLEDELSQLSSGQAPSFGDRKPEVRVIYKKVLVRAIDDFENLTAQAEHDPSGQLTDQLLESLYDIEDSLPHHLNTPDWVWGLLDSIEQLLLAQKAGGKGLRVSCASVLRQSIGLIEQSAGNDELTPHQKEEVDEVIDQLLSEYHDLESEVSESEQPTLQAPIEGSTTSLVSNTQQHTVTDLDSAEVSSKATDAIVEDAITKENGAVASATTGAKINAVEVSATTDLTEATQSENAIEQIVPEVAITTEEISEKPSVTVPISEIVNSSTSDKSNENGGSPDPNADSHIVRMFIDEASSILDETLDYQKRWQQDPKRFSILVNIEKKMHTLKGSARMLEYAPIGDLAHSMEQLCEHISKGKHAADQIAFSLMNAILESLETMVDDVRDGYLPIANGELISRIYQELGLPVPSEITSVNVEALEVATSTTQENTSTVSIASDSKVTEESATITTTVAVADTSGIEEVVEEEAALERAAVDAQTVDSTPVQVSETAQVGSIAVDEKTPEAPIPMPADWDQDLVNIFTDEAQDLLASASDSVEHDLNDQQVQEHIQRIMHTLKGSARMVGLGIIGNTAHLMESVVEKIPHLTPEQVAVAQKLLQEGVRKQTTMLDSVIRRELPTEPVELDQRLNSFVTTGRIDESVKAAAKAPVAEQHLQQPITAKMPAHDEHTHEEKVLTRYVRVEERVLEELTTMVGEAGILRTAMENIASDAGFQLGELQRTAERIDEKMRRLENEAEAQILYRREQDIGDDYFDPLEMDRFSEVQQLSRQLTEAVDDLKNLQETLTENIRKLQELSVRQGVLYRGTQERLINTQLLRFDTVETRLRRLVNQAAESVDKQVDLWFSGGEVEIERRLLDDMMAPIEHIVRNAIAHGIESKEGRAQAKKRSRGVIKIDASVRSNELTVRIIDDGAGINYERIRQKAREKGWLDEARANDEQYLNGLLLRSGFSTASTLSQLSGRGIGLDVVGDMVNRHRGQIALRSVSGRGTEFDLILPLSMSIMEVLLVEVAGQEFAVPMTAINAIAQLPTEVVDAAMKQRGESYEYGGHAYHVYNLGAYFVSGYTPDLEHGSAPGILISPSGEFDACALQIDRVLSRMEIVVKNVPRQIRHLPGMMGATVLADGKTIPVWDVQDFARKLPQLERATQTLVEPVAAKRIMIVDDSITMRKVGVRLLERNGFDVFAAKDGLDALELLPECNPDLILLDIEMPRMDGFEFAGHVRNGNFRNVPIVMVTSRTGDKHRLRADEIGVQGYLGKPYNEDELLTTLGQILGQTGEKA